MSGVPAVAPQARVGGAPLLPASLARMAGFVALAAFGALTWARMVRPAASDALLGCVLAAAAAGVVLLAVGRRRRARGVRLAATLLAALVLLAVALAAAGAPHELLAPRGWDDLAAGIGQGLGAISTVRTPYAGLDEWTRIVLVLGGCLLAAAGALLAFAPRRDGGFGFPAAAAVALGALYTVPVMQHDVRLPFLAGLAFALLLAVFLWLERLERRSAGLATALVAAAALGGYVAAPRLDGERALLDYEELAQSLTASATTRYRWNHEYGPLAWPRDGREVLRVRARRRSYWKAANLVAFDGRRWVHGMGPASDPLETTVFYPRWRQTIRFTMRALRTSQFVGAGSTLEILDSPRRSMSLTPGAHVSTGAPLRRGHAYRALVYAPRPTIAQLRSAAGSYPPELPRQYGALQLPADRTGGGSTVVFDWWDEGAGAHLIGAGGSAPAALAASPYGRVYALARRLRAGAATPYAFVRRVERHLARFRYTETPPRRSAPLASFLLRDRAGYCQQFAGAMALLLRMGGVPARVASGFSPGVLDTERREYVVRDVDAHSWVEFFVPQVGWVTRDPTPADAPARAQAADLGADDGGDTATFAGSERALDRTPQAGIGDAPASPGGSGGTGPLAVAVAVLGLLAACATALLVAARRRRSEPDVDVELAELRRALRRSGRPPPPQMTLEALARRFSGTPAASYVRTLADARYGYGTGRPTRAQRAALRRELGGGLGARGRLLAWWALPPRRSSRAG